MHPIIESIEQNNYEEFSKLLENNPQYINEVDSDGWTLLSLVTQYEMPEFASLLLDKMTPEQINSQIPFHPVHIAFENNYPMVENLIKSSKVDLNILDKSGDNFLYYADLFNRHDLIPFLIEANLNPYQENKIGQSPMLYTIENGNLEIFDLYTKKLDFSENYSDDFIKKAIKHNQVEIFKRLHPHSNLSSDDLFNLALSFEHVEIVNLVLEAGDLIPGQKQIMGLISLMCKKYELENEQESALKIADFLFDIKVPFSKFVNEEGQSAWMLAIDEDNEAIFEKLVNTNETVNIIDDFQKTPLLYAIEKRNFKFVSSILKKKANVNHLDKNKSTPLIQAVRYGLTDIVNEILKYPNVLINELNKNKETALSIALHNKRIDIATSLIWAGAEITKNPVKFIENNSVFQIGLSGSYEKAYENIEEKEINNFIALTKLGLRLDKKNENGDTLLLHFIKNGYLANFKALLACTFRTDDIDLEGNNALMCAMKKENDDYALGLLWKCKDLNYSIINNEGENVYDIAAECNSIKRVVSLIKNDPDLKLENVEKVLPLLALSGKLDEQYELIERANPKLDSFVDKYQNNLLMLSILGNNIDNFIWLLKQDNLKFDFSATNKKGKNLIDIISSLSEDDGNKFTQELSPYLASIKKNVK